MFLARTWKNIGDMRYESWVLKKGVWDKARKRYKQVYLAYIGKSKKISAERAQEICLKLGITLDEMRKVKRLRIVGEIAAPNVASEHVAQAEPGGAAAEQPIVHHIPTLIKELREKYELEQSPEDYQVLAMRIGVLHVTASELRLAETAQKVLTPHQQRQIAEFWLRALKGQQR